MGSKRSATTELNHDNWDSKEEPEDRGTISIAPEEVLQTRVIKAARRRLPPSNDGTPKTPFSGFTGFKTTATSSASTFNFLTNSKVANPNPIESATKTVRTNGSSTISVNGTENPVAKTETASKDLGSQQSEIKNSEAKSQVAKKSSDYYAKLKGLNESVASWIKSHVDTNPFCILTPIFKDYEKYLNEIEAKHGHNSTDVTPSMQESASAKSKQETVPAKTTESHSEKSIFGNTSSATSSETTELKKTESSIFGNITNTTKSIFSNAEKPTEVKSFFGNVSSERNPFLSKSIGGSEEKQQSNAETTELKPTTSLSFPPSNTSATFSFGQSSATSIASAGFSFGGSKPYSFGNVARTEESEEAKEVEAKDDDDEPPKPDFKPVVEEGAIYEQRCKVFIKKDLNYTDRGVGTLYLKPTPNEKIQLIVRADTSCGNLLLNTILMEGIPMQRMGKNNVMMVLLPTPDSQPPPTPVLLRVKTSEDADALLEVLNKHKK